MAPKSTPSVRLKAAILVLKRTQNPNKANWAMPIPIAPHQRPAKMPRAGDKSLKTVEEDKPAEDWLENAA